MMKHLTKQKVWLAPLAGVTDKAFRHICKECGADVLVTEMVSADGLVYDFERSFEYADFGIAEKPLGIQIFGSKPDTMAKSIDILLNTITKKNDKPLPDFIDINMGCPVKKVVKRGAGSALLKNLPLASAIVFEVGKALEGTGIALSAKIRSGWDSSSIVAVETAQLLEQQGLDMIIIHPRTRSQMYSGKSDWSIIKAIKEKVSIPVIGNGDIKNIQDAVDMFSKTNCDSIMIGRGVLGKPWLFREIKEWFLTGSRFELSYHQKFELILKHFKHTIINKGEERAVKEMKTHFCYYTKGIAGGSTIRNLINQSSDTDEMIELIKDLYNE